MNTHTRPRKTHTLKIIAITVITIILLALISAPTIVKTIINNNSEAYVGRKVQIEKLRYNYFTSTLKVINFTLYEQNGTSPFFAFDTFMVNLKPLKLFKNEIHVQQLQIINPSGQVWQMDTLFNFSDLLELQDSDETVLEAQDTLQTAAFKLNLNKIEMKNGDFSFTDRAINNTIHLEDISFIIPQIYWNQADSSSADLAFKLSDGGTFESALKYKMGEGIFNGHVAIDGLALHSFLPYLQQYMHTSALDGTLSSKISFVGNEANMQEIQLKGYMQIDDFALYDNQHKKVLGATQQKVIFKHIKPMQNELLIEQVQLDEPYVYFALIDSSSNLMDMMLPFESEEPNEATSDTSGTGFTLALNHLIINKGWIDFSDQRLRETFNYELSDLTVDMDTLELNDDWVNISANMKLNKRGNLDAKIGVNPFAPIDSIQIDYVLSDFQLPDLNMYAKHYVGLPILFGNMYYVSKTSIVNQQLTSSNELIIRNVEMGRKTGGLYDLPVKLALFILKDSNGDINLDIPVRGDLSDPKTRIAPIVFKTLKNFTVKLVASPFKALGKALGADPKQLEEITFDYGDTTLTHSQMKRLNLLLELRQQKPELQIDMHYLNDKKLERSDAARQIAHQTYFAEKNKKASSNMKDYTKFLQKRTGLDSLLIQDYELALAQPEQIDSVMNKREDIRLAMIKNYIKQNNDSSQIRVFGYAPSEVLNIGSRPKMILKYSLYEDRVAEIGSN